MLSAIVRFHCQSGLISVYLTGATLFLSLLLARVFYIVLDFIQVQEKYSALQNKAAKASGAAGEQDNLRIRIKELEQELNASQAKDRDFGELRVGCLIVFDWSDTLKKQAAQQSSEYNRLADEHNKAVCRGSGQHSRSADCQTNSVSNKKAD